MSVFTYNGVSIPYPFHLSFNQEAVPDDVSGTDWAYTKLDVRVQGLLNVKYIAHLGISPDSPDTIHNAAGIMNDIRQRLLKPRKTLSITSNGVELVPPAQVTGTVDARNGPVPQSVVINQLTNDTFVITFHVVAHYWEKRATGLSTDVVGNNVLYNRWTEEVDIDRAMYSTVTRTGKYAIRSDNVAGLQADQLRSSMARLGVPSGFDRIRSHYRQSADGLCIEYTIVDREVFKHPPKPAYEADGEYVESTTNLGAIRWGECRVRLRGAKGPLSPQLKLVETALAVAALKLSINGATKNERGGFNHLDACVLAVGMYDNWVEVRLRSMMYPRTSPGGKARFEGIASFNFQGMTVTPLSDRDAEGAGGSDTPPVFTYGTAGFLLRAAAYYDPSLRATLLDPSTGQLTAGRPVGTAGARPET